MFKVGDVVQLKSGGPMMTVCEAIPTSGYVQCVWFADQQVTKHAFLAATLELAKDI